MKRKNNRSTVNAIEIIENIESQLSSLKKALEELKETQPAMEPETEEFKSVREYEFCGMWKDREDLKGLSSSEWLEKMRREQWSRT